MYSYAPAKIETANLEKDIDKLIEEKLQNQRRCAAIRVKIHRLKKAIAAINQLDLTLEDANI